MTTSKWSGIYRGHLVGFIQDLCMRNENFHSLLLLFLPMDHFRTRYTNTKEIKIVKRFHVYCIVYRFDNILFFQVVRELQVRFGSRYTFQNVLLSGTHTHSGPAGYIQYLLYGITSLGFDHQNFRSIVDGIVQSIERADNNVVPGKIKFNVGELLGANINRSPTSYLANPVEERNM
jgi:hypothetical protein